MPCIGGMAAGFPCANVDLLAHLPLSTIGGGSGNDVWGWTDPMSGREYALMGRTNGTAFVDVTDPANPVYLGNLPTQTFNSTWRDIKVYANHAFIVSEAAGHGIQVFDLTQLRTVAAPPATFAATAHYTGFSNSHNIAINEQTGFAYAVGTNTCAGGLHMIDIRNPVSPVMAGCFSADGYTHDTQCVIYQGPDVAHVGREICFSSNEDTLTIVDVTNKSAPVMLSRTGYSQSGYAHQGWLTENHAFFLLDDESDELTFNTNTRTHIWDVQDLDAPRRVAIYEAAILAIDHNLYIRGNFAYLANYRSGLRILDISGIAAANLREVAYFDVYPADDNRGFNGAWSTFPFFLSGNILISGIEQGLFVVRHNLAGTGQGLPNYTQSLSVQNLNVVRGQSASVTLTVAAQNGFSSPVTLACSGAPALSNCTFSQNPITPGAMPASTTVTISTTAPSALGPRSPSDGPTGAPLIILWMAGIIAVWLVLRATPRRRVSWALGVGLLCLLLAVACGGDTAPVQQPPGPPPNPGTPPGTYTITLTGTSGSIQRTSSVTLVVM